MKNFFLSFIITLSFFLMAFRVVEIHLEEQTSLIIEQSPPTKILMPKLEVPKVNVDLKDHSSFLNKIGHYESSNDYTKVNRLGYMGRYQFHRKTLKLIGIKATRKEFLSSPTLQEEAMRKLLTENKKSLNYFIHKYEGKKVRGIYITESGVLAAAHLGGVGNVVQWFRTGDDFKDANGTSITKYMKVFSGYNLNL